MTQVAQMESTDLLSFMDTLLDRANANANGEPK